MRKIIIMAIAIFSIFTTNIINAQSTALPGTGGGGTGGGGTTTCTTPSFSASNTNSTLSSTTSSACAPNTITGAATSSIWTVVNNSTSLILCRIAYNIQRTSNGASVGVSYGGSFTVQNNSTLSSYMDVSYPSNAWFNVTGNYTSRPTIQWYCSVDGLWKGATSGITSSAIGVTINPPNTANSFSLNGMVNSGTVPVLNQCPSSLLSLTMQNIVTGKITNYQIIVEKGSSATTFPGGAMTYTQAVTTATSVPSSFNLHTLCGTTFLPTTYTGFLRVSLKVTASGQCDNGLFTKSQVFQIGSVSTQTDFKMYKSSTLCSPSTITKDLVQSLPIPVNTTPTTKQLLCSTLGWVGANSAGVAGVDVAGPNIVWNLKVYEVNGTGIDATKKKVGAPDIVNFSGTGDQPIGQYLRFNDVSIDFNSSNPPFYYSTSTPIYNEYFSSYYTWASANGQLSAFSAKIYAAELSVTVGTCIVSNKGYFRIANGTGAGLWKTENNADNSLEDFITSPIIYPNPATDYLSIEYSYLTNNTQFEIIDLFGKVVLSQTNLKATGRNINISQLSNGVYFYKLRNSEDVFEGKIIKQ